MENGKSISKIISARLSRRNLIKGLAAGVAAGAIIPASTLLAREAPIMAQSTLTFTEITGGLDHDHHVPDDYAAQILLRWGDRLHSHAPAFDPQKQTAAAQEQQFGYNCDFIAFMPLPQGSQNSDHGILCVNHEYTDAPLMFHKTYGVAEVEVEMMAHGMSFVEIKKTKGGWEPAATSPYNRRVTAKTPIRISGPAAGHDKMKTSADTKGVEVLGTIGNCAGGVTPWGTVLTCEENFHHYFGNQQSTDADYNVGADEERPWRQVDSRFDLGKEPNEPHRFGWVVEIDPYNPTSKPVKRTALGRLKHEGATCIVNKDGHVVVYMGDDGKFECVYKFVTKGKYDPDNRAANMDLLDEGTLYVARFEENGKLRWLPLDNKNEGMGTFPAYADVLVNTRLAAKAAGGTPMDRPEDVEPNPVTGRIYVMLTNNVSRSFFEKDAANPRSHNAGGHILEIVPPGGDGKHADHAAEECSWNFFIIAGKPGEDKTSYANGTSDNGWLACPDNCAFDNRGRIWITTDRSSLQQAYGTGDGLYAADTLGNGRALTKLFFRGPVGAEICGPCFTPDNKTLFLAVQHPGEGSSFAQPSTRWPDFKGDMPPRPSVVAINKKDGDVIGS